MWLLESHQKPQQARVHEAKEGKKVREKPRPYAPGKDQSRGRARENNAPPRYNFMVGLADLIALPAVAARLRVPEKTDKVLGRKMSGVSFTRPLATHSTPVWRWDTNWQSW